MNNKVHNFSAGPSILPNIVFEQASSAINDFNNSGLSILEISHRSKDFVEVLEEARSISLDIASLNKDDYSCLFLQGGASMQFLMVAYNFLNNKAAYVNTGSWSTKAIKEAKMFGDVSEIASSADKNFNYIPDLSTINDGFDYVHITSNNTIFGTQFHSFPETDSPLFVDMSSDIFSRKIDVKNFDLIYAGAQKNMGPAGTTLYIFNKDILGKSSVPIPTMLDLKTHSEKDSMFNTPPVFAVYASMLTLKWLQNSGGLNFIEKQNEKKADLIYNQIDNSSLFKGTANLEDRSTMNVTFTLENDDLNETFNAMLSDAKINGLKGHRSVGGFRASMYNAMPIESVQVLVDVMKELETKKG